MNGSTAIFLNNNYHRNVTRDGGVNHQATNKYTPSERSYHGTFNTVVGTTSKSDSTSHAILLSWLIVFRPPPLKLLRKPRYGAFHLFAKYLGTIPPSILLTYIAASEWDRPRQGHLRQTTICHLWRSAQSVPATPFGDRRRPLLTSTANENRSYKPATWPTPSRQRKDFSKSEDYKPAPWHTPSRRAKNFSTWRENFKKP